MFRRRYADVDDAAVVDETTTPAASAVAWSPAQIVGAIVGIGFLVLGIVAMTRTGFDTSHLDTPHKLVWSLPHSPLLALSEIVFGALMIVASVVPGGIRTLMALLGVISLVFGILCLVGPTPSSMTRWFAVSQYRSGWFFTIVGAVVVLATIVSPVFLSGTTRTRRVRRVGTYA